MSERGPENKRKPKRPDQPAGPRPRPDKPPGPRVPPKRAGGLGMNRIGGNDFELRHPRCVQEMELDFQEGIELREAGDPEAARDALRYALQGCGDNLWVHVALGRIALEDFRDPTLARGHFGYAFELAERAIPRGFRGRLPRHRPANRPFYDAIEGLVSCYEALGKGAEATHLRRLAVELSGAIGGAPGSAPGGSDNRQA
jgi:hypothetical protein